MEEQRGLGDAVKEALTQIGVTEDRVKQWVGGPCGCQERQAKLNALGWWAKRIRRGILDQAKEHLERLMGDQ
jgi:hypothetical protein